MDVMFVSFTFVSSINKLVLLKAASFIIFECIVTKQPDFKLKAWSKHLFIWSLISTPTTRFRRGCLYLIDCNIQIEKSNMQFMVLHAVHHFTRA
jgi:hypothetical protein